MENNETFVDENLVNNSDLDPIHKLQAEQVEGLKTARLSLMEDVENIKKQINSLNVDKDKLIKEVQEMNNLKGLAMEDLTKIIKDTSETLRVKVEKKDIYNKEKDLLLEEIKNLKSESEVRKSLETIESSLMTKVGDMLIAISEIGKTMEDKVSYFQDTLDKLTKQTEDKIKSLKLDELIEKIDSTGEKFGVIISKAEKVNNTLDLKQVEIGDSINIWKGGKN